MIHSGSRHWGKFIGDVYVSKFQKLCQAQGISLEDRMLAYAGIGSRDFDEYYNIMKAALNFAVANRHRMMLVVREAFASVFGSSPADLRMSLLYDIAHNVAKFEEIDGTRYLVLRKGATRAFPAHHPRLKDGPWYDTGHPVITPGSMGTSSHVLVGLEGGKDTFYSINHGSGRRFSRHHARKTISDDQFLRSMEGILYNVRNINRIKDEAPDAYKDINDVIDAVETAGLAKVVATLKPQAVVKG